MSSAEDLSALVSSRICHDLISPIGAIGNGLELLLMSHNEENFGPEFALIQDSVAKANAQISLYRVAFGKAAQDSHVSGSEIGKALNDCYGEGRIKLRHLLPPQVSRQKAKAALLGIMCLERALPRGGTIAVKCADDHWTLMAEGEIRGLSVEGPLNNTTDPAEVQTGLFHAAIKAAGTPLRVTRQDQQVTLKF